MDIFVIISREKVKSPYLLKAVDIVLNVDVTTDIRPNNKVTNS